MIRSRSLPLAVAFIGAFTFGAAAGQLANRAELGGDMASSAPPPVHRSSGVFASEAVAKLAPVAPPP